MPKLFYKLALVILLSITNQNSCMFQQTMRFFGTSEATKIKKISAKLTKACLEAGYPNFEIMVINRQYQRVLCAKSFCVYSKHILDPKSDGAFKYDPQAACLCTRQTSFDTPEHAIQLKLTKP